MSNTFHIWYYLKDFMVLNIKEYNYIFPTEIIQYVYSYIISDKFKIEMNNKYVSYIINKKLDNNNRWRNSCAVAEACKFVDPYKYFNKITGNICHQKTYIRKYSSNNIHEEITLNRKDLPYYTVTDNTDVFNLILRILDNYQYSYVEYRLDNKYYACTYKNREDVTNRVDRLLIKMKSN